MADLNVKLNDTSEVRNKIVSLVDDFKNSDFITDDQREKAKLVAENICDCFYENGFLICNYNNDEKNQIINDVKQMFSISWDLVDSNLLLKLHPGSFVIYIVRYILEHSMKHRIFPFRNKNWTLTAKKMNPFVFYE